MAIRRSSQKVSPVLHWLQSWVYADKFVLMTVRSESRGQITDCMKRLSIGAIKARRPNTHAMSYARRVSNVGTPAIAGGTRIKGAGALNEIGMTTTIEITDLNDDDRRRR